MADPRQVAHPAKYWSDRKGQAIVAIVAHGTGGGLQSSLTTLQTGDGRGVSIHVLIDKDGTQYVMVPDDKGANHAGAVTSSFTLNGHTYTGGAVNRATLGVELVNMQDGRDPYPVVQLQSLGWLVTHWRTLHGPLPILRHGDLDPTRRRDPYQLTTNTIEQYAAAAIPPAQPTVKKYRVRKIMISQRREGGAPYAGEVQPGEVVDIDMTYADTHTAHLASGVGFVRLEDLEVL
jgi:N-acetyl-anhydromuramyl-L-alanine amidase AmpD